MRGNDTRIINTKISYGLSRPMGMLENLGRYKSRNISINIQLLFEVYILKK